MDLHDITLLLMKAIANDDVDRNDNGDGNTFWTSTAAPNTNENYMPLNHINSTSGHTDTSYEQQNANQKRRDQIQAEIMKAIGVLIILWAIVVPLLALFGLVGNGLTIAVLWRREMRSTTVLYLRSLAITDTGLLIFFVIALTPISLSYRYTWPNLLYYRHCIYPVIYTPMNFTIFSLRLCNVWTTVAVSVERFIAICLPFKARTFITRGKTLTVIYAIIIFSIVSCLPKVFATTHETNTLAPDYNGTRKADNCLKVVNTTFGSSNLYQQYNVIHYTMNTLIIPLVILVVTNGLVIKELVLMKRRKRSPSPGKSEEERDVSVMLALVIIVFIFCQMPAVFTQFTIQVNAAFYIWLGVTNTLVTANSALNFLIYTALGRTFRRSLILVFRRVLEETSDLSRRRFSISRLNSKSNEVSKDTVLESETTRFNADSTSK